MSRNRPPSSRSILVVWILVLLGWSSGSLGATPADTKLWVPEIPKAWDDAAVASMEVPLAYAPGSPVDVPSAYNYRFAGGNAGYAVGSKTVVHTVLPYRVIRSGVSSGL